MHQTLREALSFVAPGLLHRLGNALFTIQGHAQLLDGVGPEGRGRRAILGATERGSSALGLMRALLGQHHGGPENASDLLALLGDVLRVPARENGHSLSVQVPKDGEFRAVDPASFCPAVLEAVRLLVTLQPAGQTGRIETTLVDGEDRSVIVRFRVTATQGTLPFPLPDAEIREGLARMARGLPLVPRVRVGPGGLDVVFGSTEGGGGIERDSGAGG